MNVHVTCIHWGKVNSALRALTVLGGSILLTLAAGWGVGPLFRRANARHPETPLWNLLRRCHRALLIVLFAALLRGACRQIARLPLRDHAAAVGRGLSLTLIGAGSPESWPVSPPSPARKPLRGLPDRLRRHGAHRRHGRRRG
ncbi:hypothetical protein Slala05_77850 [Streptomyces lavendulae subsp. lavendulae]|nr:hypothetical protein Slala05_77850 [Streptomyces lavendulae subsp. lavendulae]